MAPDPGALVRPHDVAHVIEVGLDPLRVEQLPREPVMALVVDGVRIRVLARIHRVTNALFDILEHRLITSFAGSVVTQFMLPGVCG